MHTFYMHDRITLTADMYRILMEDITNNNKSKNLSYSFSDIKERLNKKCILSHNLIVSFDDDNSALELRDSNSFAVNVPFRNYERCDFIRKYYTILTLIRKDQQYE